jgi:uncharacterized membrane protein YbaN (DUF454 family)
MLSSTKRYLFITFGFISLFLGVIGIFIPLLPTTPFAILAAYFFSKSSKQLHEWLLRRKYLGPIIIKWEAHGVIEVQAKCLASIGILALFSYTLIFVDVYLWIKLIVAAIGLSVLLFIWSRPSVPVNE